MPLSDKDLLLGNPAPVRVPPIVENPSLHNPVFPNADLFTNPASQASRGPSLDALLNMRSNSKSPVASEIIPVQQLLDNQRYNRYSPFDDNEEIYAQGQSSMDRWANGLVKFGVTTLGTFAQGLFTLPDTISGVRSALKNGGDLSGFYNSDGENALDTWQKSMEDLFPNYATKWEREHPFMSAIPFSGGAANFWADKVIKNLGFTVGAIGSAIAQDVAVGFLTGGSGDVPLIAGQVGKAALWLNKIFTRSDKVAELLSAAKTAGATAEQLLNIRKAEQIAMGMKIGGKGSYLLNLYGASRTEAGVEARQSYNDLKKELEDEFVAKNGFGPLGEDAKKIEDTATAAANARFGGNMALLTVSNMVQFDNILKTFSAASRAATLSNGAKIAATGIDAVGEVGKKTLLNTIGKRVGSLAPSLLSEGVLEEGGQYALEKGTQDYFRKKYNGEIKGSVNDMLNSSVEGLKAQFGTQEGLENMFLGALTGGIFGAAGPIYQKARGIKDTTTTDTLYELNREGITGSLQRNYDDAVDSAQIVSDLKTAVNNNDIFAFKNLKHDMFFKYIYSALPNNRMDVRIEQLKMLKDLNAEDFQKMFSVEDNSENRKTSTQYVDNLIAKAKDIQGAYNSISSVFTNAVQLSRKSSAEDIDKYQAFEGWKSDLAQYMSYEKDSQDRTSAIHSNVAKINARIPLVNFQELGSAQGLVSTRERNAVNLEARKVTQELADPKEKAKAAKDIKFLEDQNKKIDEFLKNGKDEEFIDLFKNQINYDINGSSDFKESIQNLQLDGLVNYSIDLSKIEGRRAAAKNAIDNLTSKDGFKKYSEQRAAVAQAIVNQQPGTPKETITLKTKRGTRDYEIGTEYVLGKVVKYDAKGKEVYRFPSITLLAKNEDGTIKVQDKSGKIYDISESDMEDYSLGRMADILKHPKANYYFAHANSIMTFNFGKDYSPPGRLEYDPETNILTFVYKDKKGKVKRMEVTLDQTKAKKGFDQAQLRSIGKLTPVQEEAQAKADKADDSDRIQAKKAARLSILTSIINDSRERVGQIQDKLKTKKNELSKIEQDLKDSQDRIENSTPKGKGNYTQLFKKATKTVLRASMKLSDMYQTVSNEITDLENEQGELDFNISYFEDLSQNIDELPTATEDFVQEIKDQKNNLESLILQNGQTINKLSSLIKKIESSFTEAVDFIKDLISKFSSKYSDSPLNPLTSEFSDYLASRKIGDDSEAFSQDASELYEMVSGLTEADILPSESKIKALTATIQDLYKENDQAAKELLAKEVILKKFEALIATFKETKAYEEKLLKDEKFRDEFFKKQSDIEKESGDTITGNPAEDATITPGEDRLKDASKLFTGTNESSEDDWDTNPSPASIRKRYFLNNVKNFPNRSNLKTILVTQRNQAAVGLPGFIETINAAISTPLKDDQISNVDKGWVVAVYVEQNPTDGSISFVDEKGNKIETPTAENIVYSTMPSTDLYNSKGKPRYRANQKELAESYQAAWKEKRGTLLGSKDVTIYDFSISRGIRIEAEKVNGKIPQNHIDVTLVPHNTLQNQLVLDISEEFISHQGENIPFPAGRPVVKYGDTLEFANNRLLTEQEQNVIIDSLIRLAQEYKDTNTFNRQITGYLQNVLYWGKFDQKAETPKTVGRNQIYVDQDFNLIIGNKGKGFKFTPENLVANASALKTVLSQLYNNVNKKTLTAKFSEPFEEITGWKDGVAQTIEWPNYQSYLLSATYPDGKARAASATPLTTNVRSLSPNVPSDSNYKQKYALLQSLDLKPVIKEKKAAASTKPKEAAKEPAKEQPKTGQRKEKFTLATDSGDINITYTIEGTKFKGQEVDDASMSAYDAETESIAKDQSISMEEAEKILDKKLLNGFIASLTANNSTQEPVTQTPPPAPTGNIYPLAGTYNSTYTYEGIKIPFSYQIGNDKKIIPSALPENKSLIKAMDKAVNKEKLEDDEEAYNFLVDQVNKQIVEEVNKLAADYNAKQNTAAVTQSAPTATGKPAMKGGLGFPQYRRVGVGEGMFNTSADVEIFKKWAKENVPNIPYEVLERMIQISPTEQAWGVFEDGLVKFYKGALKGTEYHEVFEAIWAHFLSPSQREAIINEFRSNTGTFTDRASKSQVDYATASDYQIKERIADDFGDYRVGKIKPTSLSQRIYNFFKSIVNFFKSFGTNRTLKNQLFQKIDTGGFKNYSLTQEYVDPQYSRVADLTEAETHQAVQDMSARLFSRMFRDTQSLFDLKKMSAQEFFDEIKQEWIDSEFFNYLGEDGWNQMVGKTKGFLKTLRIEFDEDNNATINSENVNKNDYMTEAFYLDVKKSSPYAIRVLLSSLIQTTGTGKNHFNLTEPSVKPSSLGGYMLANFNKTYAFLLEKLANTPTLQGMISKFVGAARDNSDFILPFKRMKGNLETGTIDYSKLNKYDWRLLINFFSAFSKQNPNPDVQYTGDEGTYIGGGNLQNETNRTVSEWVENIRNLSKTAKSKQGNIMFPLISYSSKDKSYYVDKGSFEKLPIRNVGEQVKMLSYLGVTFSEEMYNKLPEKGAFSKEEFNKAVAAIKTHIKKTPSIASLSGKLLGISGPLRSLAGMYIRATTPYQSTTFLDVNGKKRQNYIENNAFSRFANTFNSATSLDDLRKQLPELNDVFSVNSQLLKKGGKFFDNQGKRTEEKLKVNYAHGIEDIEKDKGKTVDALTLIERRMFEFNNNVQGDYYIINPADSATEWKMNMGNTLFFSEFKNDAKVKEKIVNIFTNYLRDEIELAKEDRSHLSALTGKSQKLRFFADILDEDDVVRIEEAIKEGKDASELVNKASIGNAIIRFLESKRDQTKATLRRSGKIGVYLEPETGVFLNTFSELSTNFTSEQDIDRFTLTDEQLDSILLFRSVNYAINNMELHKVFFGDPFQFDIKENGTVLDELKRIKLFGSPRRTTFDMPEFNSFLASEYNKGLKKGIPGWKEYKSFLNTSTMTDVEVAGSTAFMDVPKVLKTAYEEVNEADAASWLMDVTFREARNKNGQWGDEADEWMDYQMAYTRKSLFANKVFTDYPKELQESDNELLEGKKPSYPIEVLKPIVSGNKHGENHIELVVDKFSQLPLFYSFVEGTKLEDLYIKMFKENMDYVVVKSGRKVGREALHPLYKDGKFNTDPFNNLLQVPWKAWSILVETSFSQGKRQIRGSQPTKLITMDLMEAGVPLTPEIGQKIRRNNDALNNLTREGYASLIKKLGLKDNGTSFSIVDVTQAATTLRNEMFTREASDNMKESLEVENGQFKYAFEASAAYIQIRNMLYSMVDKNITSPKMNGAPHVQVPSTLWETEDRGFALKTKDGYKKITAEEYEALSEADKKKVALTSNSLKWYTKEEPWIEVMLPHWFKTALRPNKKGVLPSDAELLKQLDTPEGKKILSGIGFRIPTDALHAIENFRVKGFLPQDMGYTVVVPSEITVKAGSDFDIDKLNTYLSNVYVDYNNKVRYAQYKGNKEDTLAFYRDVFLEDADIQLARAEKSNEKNNNLLSTIDALNDESTSDKYYNKWSEILNRMMGDEDIDTFKDRLYDVINRNDKDIEKLTNAEVIDVLMETFAEKMHIRALENEYFESMRELLELPENFERLLTPTTYGNLPAVAKKLNALMGIDEGAIKGKLLDPEYVSSQRHAFIIGKSWVGIAAVHATGHSLKQRANITIDVSKAPPKDKVWLGDGKVQLLGEGPISLSKIKDTQGNYISESMSSFINAIVDVAKNPFFLTFARNQQTLSVALLLKEMGIDDYTIGYFLHQPIIDRLYDDLESEGVKNIFNAKRIEGVSDYFGGRSTLDNSFTVSKLSDNIQQFYKGKPLSDGQNEEQVAILLEYLKYATMAAHNFKFTQASNYDVASFLNGFDIAKKMYKTELAEDNNIITSVKDLLGNSPIGVMASYLDLARQGLSEFFKYDQVGVKEVLEKVLQPYMEDDVFMSNEQFQKIGTQVITSFTDYLMQTKRRINTAIPTLIVNASTSIAQQLARVKALYPDNIILQNLTSDTNDREQGSKTLKLKVKSQEAYDDNLMTGSLKELRNNPETAEFYGNFVRVAVLQGSAFSNTNLTTLIPIKDYAEIISPIINKLSTYTDLINFADNKAFQRGNWRNNTLVPEVEPAFFERFYENAAEGATFFSSFNFPTIKALGINTKDRQLLYVPLEFQAQQASYQVLKMKKVIPSKKNREVLVNVQTGSQMTKRDFYNAIKRGDTTHKDYYGYMRVEDSNGEPIVVVTKNKKSGEDIHNYVYRQINLWGDKNMKEYYEDGSPSQVDNGTMKIKEEMNPATIVNYLTPESTIESLPDLIEDDEVTGKLNVGSIVTDLPEYNIKDISKSKVQINNLSSDVIAASKRYFSEWISSTELYFDKNGKKTRVTMSNLQEAREAENEDGVYDGKNIISAIIDPLTYNIEVPITSSMSTETTFASIKEDYQNEKDPEYKNAFGKFMNKYGINKAMLQIDNFESFKNSLERTDC